jgi:3-methyladenine DNA glycosylase AlkD
MQTLADQIEATLRAAGTAERAEAEKRYLKSDIEHLGAGVPAVRGAMRRLRKERPQLERAEVLALVEALWKKPVHERRMAAVEVLDAYADRLEAEDLALVERLIRQARTWALSDNLSATVAGALVERYPALAKSLDRWAKDDDFWIRRGAMLALLKPLRAGKGDWARFGRYADAMLEEKEFFIRKAIGWVLRDASKKAPERVVAWLRPRAGRASGVTLREAVKHLPDEVRREVMETRTKGPKTRA